MNEDTADGDKAGEPALFDIPGPRLSSGDGGRVVTGGFWKTCGHSSLRWPNDASAVTDDPRALQMARDLSEVFAEHAGWKG